MEKIDYPKIKPEKITKPIQLLAVWFIGLIFIDGLFILATTKIDEVVLEYFLVIASILNVPLFLYLLFKLQTKFRAELQEDSYYSKYLDKNTQKEENIQLEKRVDFRNEIEEQFINIDKKLDNINLEIKEPKIEKDVSDIIKSYDNLLSLLSHNLKSSLQGIKSGAQYLDMLIQEPNASKDKIKEVVDRIYTNAQLNEISLDNILFQKNDNVFLNDEIRIAYDIIYPVTKTLSSIALYKNIKVNLSLPESVPLIKGDTKALKIAFYNAFENAIKYSPNGNEINVKVQISENEIVLSIINKTKVISPTEVKDIIKQGYRGRNAINQPGSGIGLYVANQIVEKHNGLIQFSFENEFFITKIKIPYKQ